MGSSETVQPSFVLPNAIEKHSPSVGYIPSMKCCVFWSNQETLAFLNTDSGEVMKNIVCDYFPTRALAPSTDGSLLAVSVNSRFIDLSNTIPAHIRFYHLNRKSTVSTDVVLHLSAEMSLSSFNRITHSKFFPDGSKIIITQASDRRGPWCKILTIPEGLWVRDGSVDPIPEHTSGTSDNQTLPCEEVDVFKQGYPIPDERAEPETQEEYFNRYNEMYYASNIDGGFFCLAISPDTTRLLAGDNDGEVYIMDQTNQKVLQCVRAYGHYKTVTGCHYNPVYGHYEFATCDECGFFDIWHVEDGELDNDTEKAVSVHRSQFEVGTSCCAYSPDGELIALTSSAVFKTHIISSHSGEVMYILVYKEEYPMNETYFLTSSFFVGNLCQVATTHNDSSLCFWKLPLVYSLKTLCLLALRALVNYNNVTILPLSIPLKLQLKYLYV